MPSSFDKDIQMTAAELDTLARLLTTASDPSVPQEVRMDAQSQYNKLMFEHEEEVLALARVGLAQQELVKHLEIAVNLLLDFDERNQKLFCRICGCRDEHRLHKDNCKVYAMQMVLAGLPLPAPPAPPEAER